MLARIVYPVLVLARRRVPPEFRVLGPNSTSDRLTIGTDRVCEDGSPPKPGELNAAARSRSRQIGPHETGPYPRPLEDRLDAGLQP